KQFIFEWPRRLRFMFLGKLLILVVGNRAEQHIGEWIVSLERYSFFEPRLRFVFLASHHRNYASSLIKLRQQSGLKIAPSRIIHAFGFLARFDQLYGFQRVLLALLYVFRILLFG